MAGRNFFGPVRSNHPDVVLVSGLFTFSADATPTCAITESNGYISSCAQASAEGVYTVTFAQAWAKCLGVLAIGLADGVEVQATAQSLPDSTPTVTLTFQGATGTNADPTSSVCYLTFIMKNSSCANQA
jgi:hypothetical protein